MIVSQMIKLLEGIKKEHGDVKVYFDCPDCKTAFIFGKLETEMIHLIGKREVK